MFDKIVKSFICLFIISSVWLGIAYADIKLKMIVANPSDTDNATLPVKTYLPKGITPDDVTDKGDFKIEYDFEKSLYYAYQEVTLKPLETATLAVKIRDIWVVQIEKIDLLKVNTQKIVDALKNTEYRDQAKILGDSISARLNKIVERQSQSGVSIEQRMSNFEIDTAVLKEVKKDIGVLEDLALEIGGDVAKQVGSLITETSSVTDPIRMDNIGTDAEKLGSVKFKIDISNSLSEARVMPVKYYLPVEVKNEHIIDSSGLEVGYDYQRSMQYVFKDNVEFAPREQKQFIVEVKDVWVIPPAKIQALIAHADKLAAMLGETEFKESALTLKDKMTSSLAEILTLQNNPDIPLERHIANYRQNLVKFDEAKKDTAKLERMVVQIGGSPGVTIADLELPGTDVPGDEHGTKDDKPDLKKRQQVLGKKGLDLLGKSVFKGRAPDLSTTWKVIWVIIGFLAIISFLFFILWWLRLKSGEKKENL